MNILSYLGFICMIATLSSCISMADALIDDRVHHVLVDECNEKWPNKNPADYLIQGCIIQEKEKLLEGGLYLSLSKGCADKGREYPKEERIKCIVQDLKELYHNEKEQAKRQKVENEKAQKAEMQRSAKELSKKMLKACDSYGFKRGTDKYSECIQKEMHMWKIGRAEERQSEQEFRREMQQNRPIHCTTTRSAFGKSYTDCY